MRPVRPVRKLPSLLQWILYRISSKIARKCEMLLCPPFVFVFYIFILYWKMVSALLFLIVFTLGERNSHFGGGRQGLHTFCFSFINCFCSRIFFILSCRRKMDECCYWTSRLKMSMKCPIYHLLTLRQFEIKLPFCCLLSDRVLLFKSPHLTERESKRFIGFVAEEAW